MFGKLIITIISFLQSGEDANDIPKEVTVEVRPKLVKMKKEFFHGGKRSVMPLCSQRTALQG